MKKLEHMVELRPMNNLFASELVFGLVFEYFVMGNNKQMVGAHFKGDKFEETILLPIGDYKFLFTSKSATKDQCAAVVGENTENAIESFQSLLRLNDLDVKKNYAIFKLMDVG